MHNDEWTSHLHIDYIPVSYDNTRGMKVQNSLAGALRQQGFGLKTRANYTEQMQWENSELQVLETICNNLDELQTYYVQSEDFIKHYRAYFEASAEIGKSKNPKMIEREDIEK